MMHERVLFIVSRILSIAFVLGLIYLHFFGWFYPKNMLAEETREYLLKQGYQAQDIISVTSGYDYRAADGKYYAEAEIKNADGEIVSVRYSYDVQENIYKLGEK